MKQVDQKWETTPKVKYQLAPDRQIKKIAINKIEQTALPDLFNLRFVESQYLADPQLQAIIEMIKCRDPELHTKVTTMSKYYPQYTQDFHVRDGCL